MAITYTKYPIASVDQIGSAIVSAIEASGMYDSAEYDNGTVTIANGGTTYLTINIGVTTNVNAYTDNIAGAAATARYVSTSYVSVATVGANIMVTFYAGWRCSIIFAKTKQGMNIIALCVPVNSSTYSPVVIPKDAATVEILAVNTTGMPYKDTVPAAILAGLVAASVSEVYTSPAGVYRFVRMPNTIQYPWIDNAAFDCLTINVAGETYLTDGYFCIKDA